MKKLITILLCCISLPCFAQFEITRNGIDPIIVELDSIPASKIYNETIKWVQKNYKNPDEVLKANIVNELVRINGYQKEFFYRLFRGTEKVFYDVSYSFEVEIKENKYRATFKVEQIKVDGNIVHFGITDFLGEGDINGNKYEGCKQSFENSLNALNESLKNSILGKDKTDW